MKMTGFWLVSYVVLWVLLAGAVLVILALAREVETLHQRLDSLQKLLSRTDFGSNGKDKIGAGQRSVGGQVYAIKDPRTQ
jgi:hypothetical protein